MAARAASRNAGDLLMRSMTMRRAGIGISTAIVSAVLAAPSSFAQDASSSASATSSSSSNEGRQERARERAEERRADERRRDRDAEAKLAQAQKRLEEAARQVAELSAQLGADARVHALRTEQMFRRGVIGLQLDPASGPEGVRVLEVSPGGPAAEAGVHRGDVITALNGTPTTGSDSARKLVERTRELPPDAKVKLSIRRDGKAQEVELTTRPAFAFAFGFNNGPGPVVVPPMPPIEIPDMSGLRYLNILSDETGGMQLATLTPELGSYFGTSKGVLVLKAPENDVFELKDGDVILSIDGREPQSGAHATRILRSYQPGEPINLKIMRQRHAMDINVKLPAAPPNEPQDR
jgi:C-terminal processing protease CtpA/Prc